MDAGFHIEYKDLRDEFRQVRDGVISTLMGRNFPEGDSGGIMGDEGQTLDPLFSSPSDQEANSKMKESNSPSEDYDFRHKAQETGWSHDQTTANEKDHFSPTKASQRPRKGHRKSRQGCFNCKKRKVKCQETQPACENCTKRKLHCTYPAPRTWTTLQASTAYSPSPIASINLQATPTTFSLIDMRLFHHFLLEAHPQWPVGNDSTWITQVPLIAHHNAYLMHAILGIAASHLQFVTGADLSCQALRHRILAIRGSNEAISRCRRTGSDGDALLASCYLLTFQSSYMVDGMKEFFQMLRGSTFLSVQFKHENLPMALFLAEKDHFEVMQERLIDLPTISLDLVESAEKSLALCLPFLDTLICLQFYEAVAETVESLKSSSLRSYFKFLLIYQYIVSMDKPDFEAFLGSANTFARILIAHFLAIELMMAPILEREICMKGRTKTIRHNLSWIDKSFHLVPDRMKYLIEWPKSVSDSARVGFLWKQAPKSNPLLLGKGGGQ
ncbi:Sterol uptake control protein [Lachnellula suecica]|uniref:Sterol uptake control protein n=1 Tax=Lachnellula suecica TaxID=602035 RepID=A0A8T9CBA8_9HELO|nr:Sterol uptake control protein [Lachnellula suecica]